MDLVYKDFVGAFESALDKQCSIPGRRIGSEMKFPLVREDGRAAEYEVVDALWRHLQENGWKPEVDAVSGRVIGARKPGEYNDTVASCETGYCKVEFSFAHVGDLFALEQAVAELRESLRPFCEKYDVYLLGCGVHPVTRPSQQLLMRKARSGVWDRLFHSNRHIAAEDGNDLHLFTVNTASHCHLNVSMEEAIRLVNVLNGFSGAQIALTAHSRVWRGEIDPAFRCVTEKFWDWWMTESNRVGVPEKRFRDLEDYVATIGAMRPVFVKRAGKPFVLQKYDTFSDYYNSGRAVGIDPDGREVSFQPERGDLDLHNTCYWYNARISAYYTVENRTNDQQPPGELLCVPALTLGLSEALDEATEEIDQHDWKTLREAREAACADALQGRVGDLELFDLAGRMLEIARTGLNRRERGEEKFLEPLYARLRNRRCPADDAADIFSQGGPRKLVQMRAFCDGRSNA